MDIIKFIEDQVAVWDTAHKCGFCWRYGAPLRDSDANEQVIEDCCVQVLLTNLTYRKVRQYSNRTGLPSSFHTDYTFTLNIVKPGDIGTNVYNEQLGYVVGDSKWVTILEPLRKCIEDEFPLDFCDILGDSRKIISENIISRIDWLDNNYTGWAVTYTIRDEKSN